MTEIDMKQFQNMYELESKRLLNGLHRRCEGESNLRIIPWHLV